MAARRPRHTVAVVARDLARGARGEGARARAERAVGRRRHSGARRNRRERGRGGRGDGRAVVHLQVRRRGTPNAPNGRGGTSAAARVVHGRADRDKPASRAGRRHRNACKASGNDGLLGLLCARALLGCAVLCSECVFVCVRARALSVPAPLNVCARRAGVPRIWGGRTRRPRVGRCCVHVDFRRRSTGCHGVIQTREHGSARHVHHGARDSGRAVLEPDRQVLACMRK